MTAFAKENGIKDFGSYKNKGMGAAKGRSQIYINNNDSDVADLFKKLASKAEVEGKSVSGKDYKGK